MSRISQAKRQLDELLVIQSRLSNFNDQELTPKVREELSNYIKSLTEKHEMIREDEGKTIKIWTSQMYKDNGMSSDIEIHGESGTIYICDDSLWRTIKGLDEIVKGD